MSEPNPSVVPADRGKPASDPLHLVLSFANTLSADPDVDHLRTREEAAAWLHTAALLPAEAGVTNSEHAALLRLRQSISDVLAAHTAGREDAEAAARLTKALADGRLVLTVDAASKVQLASAAQRTVRTTNGLRGTSACSCPRKATMRDGSSRTTSCRWTCAGWNWSP